MIYSSSQALATLQNLYGRFPRIIGKGDYAAVCDVSFTHHISRTHVIVIASCETLDEASPTQLLRTSANCIRYHR